MIFQIKAAQNMVAVRRVSKGGHLGHVPPPLSLMPNEKIYGD